MRRRKRLSIALAATLCLLFMGLTGYWFWASEALAEGIERWRGQQIERGYAIAYDGPQMSGFPFALTVTFDQPKVTSPQDLTWEGPTISGKAKLWDPFTIDLQFPAITACAWLKAASARKPKSSRRRPRDGSCWPLTARSTAPWSTSAPCVWKDPVSIPSPPSA